MLGPLEVDEGRIQLAPRDQVVLEALAARPGETVRAEALAEALWGETLPPSWSKVVQGCVSRLRKLLGPAAIVTSGAGYRLDLHRDDFDHLRFEDLLLRAGALLATGEPERARYASGQALGLWRGEPLERLAEWDAGRMESERLGERHRDAEELYAESAIRAGRHGDVLGQLRRMVAQEPTRERRWGLLALAQYQAGRQAEALTTLQRARATLVNEFGLDPGPQLVELEAAILRQDPSLVEQETLPAGPAACPYLGLVAYDIGDAPAFFGREADAAACLRRLDEAGILAVVGPSGCGKSSLIRAGVAAALVRDGHRVVVVTPGAHPEEVLAQAPQRPGSVLVVDQCEEALALPETSSERQAFFAGLVDFTRRGRLVVSLRADRLGELAAHPDFAHLVEKGLYLLGGMGEAGLRRAIEAPAAQAGLRLEPGLVDLLVREAEGSPAVLPLLSHVLRQTWRRREGDTLTVQGYAATGGIREAVAQSAERLYREMTPVQQGMLRALMVRLVSADDAGEPVRTRVPHLTVTPDAAHTAVVEQLVGARLLSSDGDTVEIAHESLAVAWPRLRSWLDDDVDGLRILRHLSVAAESWEVLGRPDSELYRGVRQARAAEWRPRHDPELTPAERAFLDASAALAETEERATQEQVRRERRSNQRLRAGLAAVAALLAVAIIAGALAKTAGERAEQQSVVADARRVGAEALRTPDQDLALLLAVAGTWLHDAPDTRDNLNAVLDRAPQLMGVVKTNASGAAVRPDGRILAARSWDTGVTLVDIQTRKEVARNHDTPLAGVVFNPNGTQLAASVNPTTFTGLRRVDPVPLRMLDPQNATLAPRQLGGMPTGRVVHGAFSFSNNGRWLAAGFVHPTELDHDTLIRVWDTQDLTRPVAAFTVPFLVKGNLAVNDDRTPIYGIGVHDEQVHTVSVPGGRKIASAPATSDLTLSPDGATVGVVRGSQIALLDPERLTVKSVIDEDGGVDGIRFSPKGDKLGYSVDTTLVVRSIADPDAPGIRLTGSQKTANVIGFSPDGRTLYSTAGTRLLLWDLSGDRRFLRSVPVEPQQDSAETVLVKLSPDGQTVANLVRATEGPEAYGFQILDVTSGNWSPPSALREAGAYWADMAWRPDGRAVASAHNDQWVDLWDGATGRSLGQHRVPDRYGIVYSVAFSGDSRRLLVGTHQGWVYAVDASTLEIVGEPVQVKAGVPALAVASNAEGSRALVSFDHNLQLLDLDRGRVLKTTDPPFDVEGWAWLPDGSAIVVTGTDRSRDGHGTIALLDPQALSVRETRSGPRVAGGEWIRFSRDGERFVISGFEQVGLWAVDTLSLLGSVRAPSESTAVQVPGSSEVHIASADGEVSVWDPTPEAATAAACRIAGRQLTDIDWQTYLPDHSPEPLCDL
ncbi:BTAD domain-containing putative transcriptional regulator [Knoellia sp. CPCC 206435]|uniref:nSTAND1 domain-containing NTPase n=1 Tax=Knoellia terrae TaxID=3404797 RepID=UPI003B43CDC4